MIKIKILNKKKNKISLSNNLAIVYSNFRTWKNSANSLSPDGYLGAKCRNRDLSVMFFVGRSALSLSPCSLSPWPLPPLKWFFPCKSISTWSYQQLNHFRRRILPSFEYMPRFVYAYIHLTWSSNIFVDHLMFMFFFRLPCSLFLWLTSGWIIITLAGA